MLLLGIYHFIPKSLIIFGGKGKCSKAHFYKKGGKKVEFSALFFSFVNEPNCHNNTFNATIHDFKLFVVPSLFAGGSPNADKKYSASVGGTGRVYCLSRVFSFGQRSNFSLF